MSDQILVRAPRNTVRYGLLAGTSLLAMLIGADGAFGRALNGGGGGAVSAPNVASDAAAQAAQQAAGAARQTQDSLARAARAVQDLQAVQAAARAAAAAAQSAVPNGIGAGGLLPNMPAGWTGANAPTQSVDANGQTQVGIRQTTAQAVLNWTSFNVGARTTLTFDQHGNRNWVALNRIDAATGPSQILGNIKADGQVYVVNQSGIIFGGNSQINVGSLIAAAAKITDDPFLKGIYSTQIGTNWMPSFTEALGTVRVEMGAQIATHAPAVVTAGGGSVVLLGHEVSNAGSIATPKGQALLAAGDSFILRAGFGTDGNTASTTRGFEVSPVINAGSTSGRVGNTGLIFAQQGDITLAGRELVQGGALISTTSVNTRGTIHLLNRASDTTGSILLAGGSVTAVLPELDSSETALDSQRDALIKASDAANLIRASSATGVFDNLSLLADRQDQSRIEIVSGGTVTFKDGSYNAAQGGQIAVSAGKRIFAEDGARLDVSGVRNVALAMASNNIKVNVQGNELRDSPQNRDAGVLKSNDVWIDVRNLVFVPAGTGGYASDRYYTSGGLLEVGGYLNTTAHTIGEWAAIGGSITLAAQEVITQKGAMIDLSGGSLDYAAGWIRSTNLIGSDGRRYSVDDAPSWLDFVNFAGGFARTHNIQGQVDKRLTEVWTTVFDRGRTSLRWEEAYSVGRDAGRLLLSAPTVLMDGDIIADVINGKGQNKARPTAVADGYRLGQRQVALEGALILGNYNAGGFVGGVASDIRITKSGNAAAIGAFDPIAQDRVNTAWFDGEYLSRMGLGRIEFATTKTVTIDADVTLADGGRFGIIAPNTVVSAKVIAHGGDITITNVYRGQTGGLNGSNGSVMLKAGAVLDASGVWSNALIDREDVVGQAYVNGGKVTLQATQDVILERGSIIDVSSGAALLGDGSMLGGRGGDVSLLADTRLSATSGSGKVTLDGIIKANGVLGGGTLTLESGPAIVIGGKLLANEGQLSAGEKIGIDVVTAESYFVRAGEVLPFDLNYMKTVASPGEAIGAIPAFSASNPIVLAADWTPPLATSYAYGLYVDGVYTLIYQWQSVTLRAGQAITGINAGSASDFPRTYVVPGNVFPNGIPITPTPGVLRAGNIAPNDATFAAGLRLPAGTVLARPVKIQPLQNYSTDIFGLGFSSYVIDGHQGLAVTEGAQILPVVPVYRLKDGASAFATGTPTSDVFDLWTPPVYQEDPRGLKLTQRAGADVQLNSNAAMVGRGGGVSIGTGATVTVDPGGSISVKTTGSILVDGGLMAAGGRIDLVQVNASSGTSAVADPLVGQRKIEIGTHAVLNVAARAATAVGRNGLRYGKVSDGGSITIGAPTLIDSADSIAQAGEAFIVVRAGALLDASGAAATFDLLGDGREGTPVALASNGGTIALNTFQGLYLDGTMRAAAGGAGALGGSLILTLETPRYRANVDSPSIPDDVRYFRELVISQAYRPSTAGNQLKTGTARVSVDQIKSGGFDSFTAYADLIKFDGNIDLSLGRSLALYHGALLSDGSGMQVRLAAPYVNFRTTPFRSLDGNPIYPKLITPTMTLPTIATAAGLTVEADLIDLGQLTLHGVSGSIALSSGTRTYSAAGFDTAVLTSHGDMRLGSGVTGSRLLDLNAAQLYPFTSAIGRIPNLADIATIKATERVRIGRTTDTVPDIPYSLFGGVRVWSKEIIQGGILRAPMGLIQLGESDLSLRDNYDPAVAADRVTLLPGSITSVSARGLSMPYGGTIDGLSFVIAGNTIDSKNTSEAKVVLSGRSNAVQEGALIDLSGGGDIPGSGFISGRGGSVDVLETALVNANPGNRYSRSGNQVYALVPGNQAFAAPQAAGAGTVPAVGRQVTIPDGVPGLKAGTYTLMPARYALVPGAYRVELGDHLNVLASRAVAIGNGSWSIAGHLGIAGTGYRDPLLTQLVVTPGATVRTYSQYDETGLQAFRLIDAARIGVPTPYLFRDAKSLDVRFALGTVSTDAGSALSFKGKADFTPEAGGEGGALSVGFNGKNIGNLEIVHAGSAATGGYLTLSDEALNAVGASRILVGGVAVVASGGTNGFRIESRANSVAVREGVVLSAPEVMLVGGAGGVTVKDGVRLSTIGKGNSIYSSGNGYRYDLESGVYQTNLLAVSNGLLDVSVKAGSGAGPGIKVGAAELYSEGSITLATGSAGSLSLDRNARYGAKYLTLALANINIGETTALDAAQAASVLPAGLSLSQSVLDSLLQGNSGAGIPKLQTLILSAGQAINFFGTTGLNTIDPVTGKSSLAELVLSTPAFYGLGGAGDIASITTGTLVWNGVSDDAPNTLASRPAPPVLAGGAGTGSGTLNIVADRVEFGYVPLSRPNTQLTLDRTILGFGTVNMTANERITANNRNSLSVYQAKAADGTYSGGNLNLVTPLLTGEGASTNRITAGSALTLSAIHGRAAATTDVTGAEIGLKGGSVTIGSTIALPSGKLTVEADGGIALTGAARIDLAGREILMIDVKKYSWGGDLVLTSTHGDIRQAAGSVIDLSAQNNTGGTLTATALDAGRGTIALAGMVRGDSTGLRDMGGSSVPWLGASVDLRAQTIADFAGLNAMLNAGGVFAERHFQIKRGDLIIGDGVKANDISVSVDGGALTVAGRVDASGVQTGTIRLSGANGLTVTSGAVLDAHGTQLRVDSRGQAIDANNRANVELTASGGRLALAPGATIDVRSADGIARGTVTLNAQRVTETGGDIAIDAGGPVRIDGAKSIAVNGFWRYTDARSGTSGSDGRPVQIVDQTYLDTIHGKSTTFMNAALGNVDLQGRLAGLRDYGSSYHLRPGVEITSATPDGHLVVDGDLDLSGYRYGPSVNSGIRGSGEPGMLVMRAGGNLTIKGSVNDGFGLPPVTPDDNGWFVNTVVNPGDLLSQDLQLMVPTVIPNDYVVPLGGYAFDESYWQMWNPGDTIPAGTIIGEIMVPAGAPSPVAFSSTAPRPTPGKIWAVAPMLAPGLQSWSMRFASGADLAASDSRALNALRLGDLVLDDEHFTGPSKTLKAISVVRTGTGDLDLLAGGNISMKSLFGIYTAGTQAAALLAADGSDPYNLPRGFAPNSTSVLGSAGAAYESLVRGASSPYVAWYPEQGGDLLISAGGNVTGYSVSSVNQNAQLTSGSPGNWLWRQGGDAYGLRTAWWINFGTYVSPIDNRGASRYSPPQLTGFSGFGALGGGNVAIRAGGDAGMIVDPGSSGAYASQGLNIAIGGTGRVTSDGRIVQTGGGDLTLRVGGALNPMNPFGQPSRFPEVGGVLTNVRGATDVHAGAIGRIDIGYGDARYALPGDPRALDAFEPNAGTPSGGLTLVLGDGTATLQSRGDLVLANADDAGRAVQQNLVPYSVTANGVTTSYAGGGNAFYTLWTDNTAVDVFAAGGNLTPVILGQGSSQKRDYPATLRAVAAQGSIYYGTYRDNIDPVVTSLVLAPSPTGQLEILARDSIFALRSAISMSGADQSVLATPLRPGFIGLWSPQTRNLAATSQGAFYGTPLYAFGPNSIASDLHAGDDAPQRFYAVEGDIIGLRTGELLDHTRGGTIASSVQTDRWYLAAKPVRIIAGRDIIGSGEQPAFVGANGVTHYANSASYGAESQGNLIYHANANDVSVIRAGRDIQVSTFMIAGPGTLDISAGRNIYQADKGSVISLGPVAPGDLRPGASIVVVAGVGSSGPDYAAIAARYLDAANLADDRPLAEQGGKVVKIYTKDLNVWLAGRYGFSGSEKDGLAYFATLAPEQQNIFLRQVYFAELKAGGREYNDPQSRRFGSYLRGRDMIATLFPDTDAAGGTIRRSGDITMFGGSGIRTNFGGGIELLAPGGQIVVGVQGTAPPASAGIVTQGSGDIGIYSQKSILLGLSRIMTTYGGSILGWSAEGDINAGRGARTTVIYTPPKRTYDRYGNIALAPQVPSSGAGIATLNPIPAVPPGDIDLIAPRGTIDAGEAGIRVSGNVNLAALQVLNAANIQVQGTSTGIPTVQAPNIAAALSTSNATATTQQTATPNQGSGNERPSVIIVEVLGYGGGDQQTPGASEREKDQQGSNERSNYDPNSMFQVVGGGTLSDEQKGKLTDEERAAMSIR